MIKITGKKNKLIQYSIGGIIGIIILWGWFSLPLVSKSSLDSSVPFGNPFQSRSINLYSIGGEIPAESGAPGEPLSGEMINNPVTSGEEISSSLLHTSGEGIIWGESNESEKLAEDKRQISSSDYSASAGIGSGGISAPGKKLSPMPSLSSGGGGSLTAGGKAHDKFFGSGNPKADLVPITPDTGKVKPPKVSYGGSGGAVLSSLKIADARSLRALSAKDIDSKRGGASSAFGGSEKPKSADFSTNLENAASSAGLKLDEVAADLKTNDPTLNKKDIKLPPPKVAELTPEQKQKEMEEQIKMMLLQMLIQYTIGPMFGMIGQMMVGGGGQMLRSGNMMVGQQNTGKVNYFNK